MRVIDVLNEKLFIKIYNHLSCWFGWVDLHLKTLNFGLFLRVLKQKLSSCLWIDLKLIALDGTHLLQFRLKLLVGTDSLQKLLFRLRSFKEVYQNIIFQELHDLRRLLD